MVFEEQPMISVSVEELLDRIKVGEDEWTEFKRHLAAADDVLPSIVALANGPTEGWIIFGVNDEGRIVGVLGADKLKRDLIDLCRKQCEPPLKPEVEILETDAGKVVIARVRGREQDKPYQQKDRKVYWLRKGAQNQSATQKEIERFIEEQYRVWSPLLRELTAERFRSLYEVQLSLKPLNIIIGPNASGKSNLFKALRFIRDIVVKGEWRPYQEAGDHLFWYGVEEDDREKHPDQFAIGLTTELPEQLGRLPPTYRLAVQFESERLSLLEESLCLKLAAAEREPVMFIQRDGQQVKYYVEHKRGEYDVRETRLSTRVAALREYGRDAQFAPIAALYRFVEGWRLFDIDVQAARQSAVGAEKPDRIPALAGDASNLSFFLYALSRLDPDRFDEVQDRLGRAIGFPEAVTTSHRPSLTGGLGQASIIFRERAFHEVSIPPESISDGTIRLLAHLAALLGDPAATLICIEEPNHSLHPHLMLRLADALRSVVDVEPDNNSANLSRPQVILTTHSSDFLDCFDLETEADYLQVFVAERSPVDGKTTFKPVNAVELSHWLNEYRLGELVRMGVVK
jgi:predicted ATPase